MKDKFVNLHSVHFLLPAHKIENDIVCTVNTKGGCIICAVIILAVAIGSSFFSLFSSAAVVMAAVVQVTTVAVVTMTAAAAVAAKKRAGHVSGRLAFFENELIYAVIVDCI